MTEHLGDRSWKHEPDDGQETIARIAALGKPQRYLLSPEALGSSSEKIYLMNMRENVLNEQNIRLMKLKKKTCITNFLFSSILTTI